MSDAGTDSESESTAATQAASTETQEDINIFTLRVPSEVDTMSVKLKESVKKVNITILSPILPRKRSVAIQATSDTESESEPDGVAVPLRFSSDWARDRVMEVTASPSKKRLRRF